MNIPAVIGDYPLEKTLEQNAFGLIICRDKSLRQFNIYVTRQTVLINTFLFFPGIALFSKMVWEEKGKVFFRSLMGNIE